MTNYAERPKGTETGRERTVGFNNALLTTYTSTNDNQQHIINSSSKDNVNILSSILPKMENILICLV